MTGQSPLDRLAAFVASLELQDVPEAVRSIARDLLMDTIGVILGGSTADECRRMRALLANGPGDCTVVGGTAPASALHAALLNGTSATWLDYDAGHRPPPGTPLLPAGHPPVHLVPALLAAGEVAQASGARALAAMIGGYEVAGRVGVAMRLRADVHPHGTYPTMGAAAAAELVHGTDAGRLAQVLRIATCLTLLPSFQPAYQGKTIRNVYAGVGAASGLLARELATSGVTALADPASAVLGAVSATWFDADSLLDDLGDRFEIALGYFKPFPSCRYAHPAIEAAEQLVTEGTLAPGDVVEVVVSTYALAATLCETAPGTELAAKFSIPHGVATMLVRGSADPADFREDGLGDPGVRRVSALTKVLEDPEYTAATPARRPARVSVRLRDGRQLRGETERSSGGPDDPWTSSRVESKFRRLAEPVIGGTATDEAVSCLRHFDDLDDVRDLTQLLRVGA